MAERPQREPDFDPTGQFVRGDDSADTKPDAPLPLGSPITSLSEGAAELPEVDGFHVRAELGRGGNGVVYQAFDKRLKRLVALKMLRSGLDASDEQVTRFRTEAESVARLQHAGIVQIYDFGNHEGLPFLTLEFVDGCDLTEFSRHQPLVPRVAAAIVRSVAQAIGFAHENGVLHRDLKPANILIPTRQSTGAGSASSTHAMTVDTAVASAALHPEDKASTASRTNGRREEPEVARLLRVASQAKVADFGLAKLLDVDDSYTRTGNVLGTATYMSPEQASALESVGPATDIYSLGAILYFLLTGNVPFRGATLIQTLRMVIGTEAIAPRRHIPELDADIDTICLKCLEKEPGRRYESAYALADDLDRYINGQPIQARPLGGLEQAIRWMRRKPSMAALLALVLFLAIAGPTTAVYQMKLSRDLQNAQAERDKADRQKLAARVESLLTTELRNFPDQLAALADEQSHVEKTLGATWQQAELPDNQRLRVAMALSKSNTSARAYLRSQLMTASDTQFLVATKLIIRECRQDSSTLRGWIDFAQEHLNSLQANEAQRGYATCLMAQLDPDQVRSDDLKRVSRWLCRKPEPNLTQFTLLLAPLAAQLAPEVQSLFRGGAEQPERNGAATVLAVYHRDEHGIVAELFLSADPGQFRVLRRQVGDQFANCYDLFEATLKTPPDVDDPDKPQIERRRANAAVGMLLSGDTDTIWPHLRHSADPELRSYLVHRFAGLGVRPARLTEALRGQNQVTVQRALVLALGEYPAGEFSPRDMDQLVAQLLSLNLSDPGLRSAVRWTLARFDRSGELPLVPTLGGMDAANTSEPVFQTSNGIEMVAVPVYRGFHVGAPLYEHARVSTNEKYYPVRIDRTFAISTTEVTHRMFEEFLADHPTLRHVGPESFEIQAKYPESRLSWYQAIAFCHWLNIREGVPESEWCFRPNQKGNFFHDMEITWDALDRCGYRFPTEAEWEFACRAGAETSRFYGSGNDLLHKYAWYSNRSDGRTHRVAQLKPNDLGLFDTLGNISEHCFDQSGSFESRTASNEQKMFLSSIFQRSTDVSLRGGSQYAGANAIRSAVRFYGSPASESYRAGIRVARTIRSPRDIKVVMDRLAREPHNLQLGGRYLRLLCRDGRTSTAKAEYARLAADIYSEDKGILLTGNGDCLEFAHIPFDEFEQFTIEAWVRDWKGVMFNQGRYWDPENSIWINMPRHAGWESEDGRDHYFLDSPLTVGDEWAHIALVFDGSTRRVFRNGRLLIEDKQDRVGPFKKNRAFQIGALQGRFDVGRGLLGSFRVSKQARYTKDFTPSRELIDDGETELFVHPSRVRGAAIVDADDREIGRFSHAPWIGDDSRPEE